MAVSVAAVRVASKLLLVFPKDDLGCHLIVILVDSGNRERRTGFPAIDRSQGDPPLASAGSRFRYWLLVPLSET